MENEKTMERDISPFHNSRWVQNKFSFLLMVFSVLINKYGGGHQLKDNGRAKLRNRNGNLQQKISAALCMVRIRTEGMGGWLLVRLRLGQRRVCLGSLVCHGMPALGDTDRAYLPSVTQPLSFPPLTPPCSTFLLRILCTAESITRTASPDLIELSWLRGRGKRRSSVFDLLALNYQSMQHIFVQMG